jgi:hypothetical protein
MHEPPPGCHSTMTATRINRTRHGGEGQEHARRSLQPANAQLLADPPRLRNRTGHQHVSWVFAVGMAGFELAASCGIIRPVMNLECAVVITSTGSSAVLPTDPDPSQEPAPAGAGRHPRPRRRAAR